MAKFVVDLNELKIIETPTDNDKAANLQPAKKRGRFAKVLKVLAVSLAALFLVGAVGGCFYWQRVKRTPQYSLALLVDAARRDDQKAVDELVDADAIVDDFMPQITGKAVELYGRNLPPSTIERVRQAAEPLLPAVKIRARAEISALIRDKTKAFEKIPFWAIALGASRYVNIAQENDKAAITSKTEEQQLNLTMKRSGERWQIVGVKDEELAKQVAEKIGQQLISAAGKNGIKRAGEELGIGNLDDLIKQLDGVFK